MDPNPVTQRLRTSSIRLLSSNTNINTLQLGSYCVYILNTCAYNVSLCSSTYIHDWALETQTQIWKHQTRVHLLP